jgi:hypothetical protein
VITTQPLREIMAPQRRSGAPPVVIRREAIAMTRKNATSETASGLVVVTDVGEREGEENMLLKSENDRLKRVIDALNDKITSGNSGDDSANDALQKKIQKNLNEGHKACISAYVSGIYKRLKFLNNETHEANPSILQKALSQLVVTKVNETQENYKTATLKEMRYQISQKRQYSKKQIMKKYIGT